MLPPGLARLATKPRPHRIAHLGHHDGDCRRRLLQGSEGRITLGEDHIDPGADEFRGEFRIALGSTLSGPDKEGKGLILHVAQLPQPLPKRLKPARKRSPRPAKTPTRATLDACWASTGGAARMVDKHRNNREHKRDDLNRRMPRMANVWAQLP